MFKSLNVFEHPGSAFCELSGSKKLPAVEVMLEHDICARRAVNLSDVELSDKTFIKGFVIELSAADEPSVRRDAF